ncbi:MAG: hypothetical protein M3380_12105, partial [Chloroflexota bacterium]|nr:hypothetical protein [Chloroflexota bacterium]
LYPLSYEGLRCTFALDIGRVLVRRARAGYLAPDGLCRAVTRPLAIHPDVRCRLYGWWCGTSSQGWGQ